MDPKLSDHNKGGMVAFVFAMAFTFIFFIYISFIYPGIQIDKVKEAPGPASQLLGQVQLKEPWKTSDAWVEKGKQVFSVNCQICHGPQGKGDGPGGLALKPPPRNLIEGQWQVGGTSIQLFGTISNGMAGTSMAAFGHLPVEDRWALVHFIRSITTNAPKEDPTKIEVFAKGAK